MVDFEYVEKLLSIPDLILNSEDKRNIMEYIKHLQDELNIQTALAQNGASALETSNALANKLQILTLNFNKLQEDFLKIINSETDLLPCDFCEHYIPCLADKCDSYEQGVGMTDESGKYYDWTGVRELTQEQLDAVVYWVEYKYQDFEHYRRICRDCIW